MVEVDCETDFVIPQRKVPGNSPGIWPCISLRPTRCLSLKKTSIPRLSEREREIYHAQAINEGKKPEFAEKIIEGRMKKFFAESCLLNQVYIKDESKKVTIKDMLQNLIAIIGENITINRFFKIPGRSISELSPGKTCPFYRIGIECQPIKRILLKLSGEALAGKTGLWKSMRRRLIQSAPGSKKFMIWV